MTSVEVFAQTLEPFLEWIDPYAIIAFDFLRAQKEAFNNFTKSTFEPYQLVLLTVVTTVTILLLKRVLCHILSPEESLWKKTKRISFRLLIKLPVISSIAQKQIDKNRKSLRDDLMKPYAGKTFFQELPKTGCSPQDISKLVNSYMDLGEVKWEKGRISGGVYAALFDSKFTSMMTDVFARTGYTNPLHADVFPGIRKMEAEVVRMTCQLFRGDENTCGTMTSGGTESIVMACKAMRDYARNVRGISTPEMIVPQTVHAGFDKAADLLRIRIIHIPVDSKTGMVNVNAMKKAITRNTIMLVGSSPNYPHGIIDPIEDIAKLGLKYNIPVHVDACLGGFLLPFMREAGFPVPVGDFSIRGVTSISADTHKYGYAPKGNSVVMYRDPKYRQHQFAVVPDWPGGIYVTPTISGSRAGATIATCWAALMYNGRDGYVESTRKIMTVARKIKEAISKTRGLRLMGDPLMSVIAVISDDFDILQMSSRLTKKGWNLNVLQFPSSFHICVTLMHTMDGVADSLISDIRSIATDLLASPKQPLTGTAAVYGMAQTLPDRSMISDFAVHYMDTYYSTNTHTS